MVVDQLNIQHLCLKCQVGRNEIPVWVKVTSEAQIVEEAVLVEAGFKVVGIKQEAPGTRSRNLTGGVEEGAIEISLQPNTIQNF